MKIRSWGATDVGKTRDHNEDNFLVDEDLNLYVVADGMGGHAAGEVASQIAAETVREAVIQNQDLIEKYIAGDESVQRFDIAQVLEHAVQSACSDIFQRAQNEPEKRGMGTTLSLLLVAGERGFVAHVGDSRIYLLRQNQVHQLTEDHSLVNHLVRKGRLKRHEIEDSPYAKYKNAVTRAVGVYESVEVDSLDFDVLAGDRFLLCSDGLSAYLDDENVLGAFEANEPDEVPLAFIQIANNGGGHDNITAVSVYALTDEEGEAAKKAADVRLRMEVMARMPLLAHLTYKELVRVLNITRVRTYSSGDVIIREGEPGDELYLVLDGSVDIVKDGSFITTFRRGEHFGEMALVDSSPRSATVVARDEARLLIIRRQDFYNILAKEPEVSVKLLWSFVKVLTQRLRKTTSQLSGERLGAQAEDLSDEVDVFEEDDGAQPPPIPAKSEPEAEAEAEAETAEGTVGEGDTKVTEESPETKQQEAGHTEKEEEEQEQEKEQVVTHGQAGPGGRRERADTIPQTSAASSQEAKESQELPLEIDVASEPVEEAAPKKEKTAPAAEPDIEGVGAGERPAATEPDIDAVGAEPDPESEPGPEKQPDEPERKREPTDSGTDT